MKIAYITHPISGDVKRNLNKIAQIARKINLEEPEVIPFAPYYVDCFALHDGIDVERERGIKNDITLIKKGFIDEIRLYGDNISKGMATEINLAIGLDIPIVPMTIDTKSQYRKRWYWNIT